MIDYIEFLKKFDTVYVPKCDSCNRKPNRIKRMLLLQGLLIPVEEVADGSNVFLCRWK